MITHNAQTDSEIKKEQEVRLMNGVNRWTSFYRANPHRFAKDYLGLRLNIFQQIILYMMFKDTNALFLASRGIGKTFLLAIFCACYCILYPDSKICIAASRREQAAEVISKFVEILMPNSRNLAMEIEDINEKPTSAYARFRNGSSIKIVTASDSARHTRATVLIVDEFRLIDKKILDTVLKHFLTSRREPAFYKKKDYENYPKEPTKTLYASSCWYESHWTYELVRTFVVNMIRGRSYFCCAIPYQLALKEGRLDRSKIEDDMSESTFNSVSFRMEMEALFFGQSDGGLYSYDEIDKNRTLAHPFYPQCLKSKISDKRLFIPPKVNGEIRILSADIALMSSAKNKNDATSIFINQMLPRSNNKYVNNIVYADNNEGLRTDSQALAIRKLFADFECDYLVLDTRGLGIGVCDALMADIYDVGTGTTYNALSCCNNDELEKRCTDPNAPKVIWSVQGSPEFNSQCALGLREALKQGQVKLLISEFEADNVLTEMKGYDKLDATDMLTLKLPYIHTSLLINELVNLEYETRNNAVRVKEKPNMRKDRYSSLSYNIYVAKALEREKTLSNSKKSVEEMVFHFRAPKLKKNYKGGY